MDGLAKWILLSAVAVAGCKTQPTAMTPPTNKSFMERTFAKSPPGPIKQNTVAEMMDEKDNKGPLKSETVALFADLTVNAAFSNDEISDTERDRRLDDARQKFDKALQQDPKNLEALRGLGRLYTRMGDKDRAAASYKDAVRFHEKNHQLAHEAALSFGRFEDWTTALKLWQHAQGLDPASRKYPRMIGLAQVRLGNYEAGFNSLMQVCTEAEARTILAKELTDAGQPDAAREQTDMAQRLAPDKAVQQAGFAQ